MVFLSLGTKCSMKHCYNHKDLAALRSPRLSKKLKTHRLVLTRDVGHPDRFETVRQVG